MQSGQPAQTEYAAQSQYSAQSQYPTQTAADQTAPAQTADRTTTQLPRNIQAFLEDDEDEELATKNQFTTVFDVLERMETLVEDSKSSFFSGGQVRVDREELTGLIRELKSKLPVQLERASALMRESERRLENAQSQASSIVASAQSRAATIVREANEQAQFLVGQENVVALATERARGILDTAQTKADRLTQGADRYSTSVLNELLNQLDKATHGVQSGLDVLAERQKEAAQRLPHLSDDDYPRQ
ncbi:cell division protein [Bifidobacterium simiarum]|nr:cell division protein [Bifidobacterium simiarum]